MDFSVLGPLEARDDDGRVVPLRSARERTLLIFLLLHENEVVPVEDVVAAMWEHRPPPSAEKLVRRHVSRLRHLLEPGVRRGEYRRLLTRPTGYLLRVERGELDRHRFEGLLGQAQMEHDPAASLTLLRAALGIWRGPPLQEAAQVRTVQPEIARLNELHLSTVCARIDKELHLGLHANVVAELERLIASHPLRDDLRDRLELALDRSGRHFEARQVRRDPSRRLVGAEVGRAVPVEAISHAGTALVREAPRSQGATVTTVVEPVVDVRKVVTILFTDLVGSSKLSLALDPEAFRGLLARYFGELSAIVRRHGGIVEKYIGDAMMAVFGVPTLHEDDALRAVRAAVEMRSRLVTLNTELEEGWGVRLANRIGINTGEVIAGDHRQGHLFVTGTAINIAKRLEEAGAANQILIGEATYRLVRDAAVVEPSGPLALKHGEVIHAHALVDVAADATAPPRRHDSPFVGRKHERAEMAQVFDQAVHDRSCRLVTVLGDAGIGKSRLVREFIAGLPDEVTVVRGRCLPYGEGITYWPLAEIVREITRAESSDSGEQNMAALAARLEGDEKAGLIAERVAAATGLGAAGGGTSEETFWAVRRLFEGLARRSPLVVLLDDLHWAEPTFLDLCEHVVNVSSGYPILLIGVARPELLDERPRWGRDGPDVTPIRLEPLTDAECGELIANLLGRAALPSGAGTAIARASAGNALYAEEFVAMLAYDEFPRRADDRWAAAALELSEIPSPPTIDALLSARLEGLPAGERAILQWASIEGEIFHWRAVAELARPAVGTAFDAAIKGLVRRDLIHPEVGDFVGDFAGDEAYRFRHVLIRDAAYRSLPKRRRADLHERYASWLELRSGERLREFEEIVGYHFERAFQYQVTLGARGSRAAAVATRAAQRLESAGRRALLRSDLPAAIGLLERVSGLLLPNDTRRIELLAEIGGALMECGRLTEAAHALDEAEAVAADARDTRTAAHVLIQRHFLKLLHSEDGGLEEAAIAARRAIRVFERSDDDLGLSRARRLEAWIFWNRARAEAAAGSWGRAAEHAKRAGNQHERNEILTWIASSLWFGPTPAHEGIRRCEQLRGQVRESPESEAAILRHLAGLYAMVGHFASARDLLATSNATYADLGLSLSAATSQNEAVVELLADNPAAAEESLTVGYRALEAMGERAYRSTTAALLARAMLEQGRDQAANEFAELSSELAASGDLLTQIIWRGVRARVLARRAQIEKAERLAREAVGIATRTDFLSYRADAMVDLAEVLYVDQRNGEAQSVAAAALRCYEIKGNVVAAGRTRLRLAEFTQV